MSGGGAGVKYESLPLGSDPQEVPVEVDPRSKLFLRLLLMLHHKLEEVQVLVQVQVQVQDQV